MYKELHELSETKVEVTIGSCCKGRLIRARFGQGGEGSLLLSASDRVMHYITSPTVMGKLTWIKYAFPIKYILSVMGLSAGVNIRDSLKIHKPVSASIYTFTEDFMREKRLEYVPLTFG